MTDRECRPALPATGDVVHLRSEDGRFMVVTETGLWGRRDFARCVWFDGNGVKHTDDFPFEVLVILPMGRKE